MTIDHLSFLSRREAEAATPRDDIAVISITDPRTVQPRLDGWHSVLRVEFHDIDPDQIASPFTRARAAAHYTLMRAEQAREIVAFVQAIQSNGASGIMVHCEQGVSRSAAVAKWIADRHGLRLSDEATAARNRYVYRMLEEEVG